MALPFQHALQKIRMTQFRCFESLDFRPCSGYNLVVGFNAQGKTSLLEAICVLLRLQSPRTSVLTPLIRHGQVGFGLEGLCCGHQLQVRLESGRRVFRLDSVEQKSTREYLSVARVTWFGNSDEELVRGGGAMRRRYLDFMGAQTDPNYLLHLRAYERAWKSRNLLLKEGGDSRAIHAFDEPLVTAGVALAARRRALVTELTPFFLQAAQQLSGKDENLDIRYEPGFQSDFRQELLASKREERRLRHTVVGVHRDELQLLLAGGPAVTFASEGQRRTIALALKLAQVRLLTTQMGYTPILLLDDIFGELDPERRERFLAYLPPAAQKIIATTSLENLSKNIPDATAIFRIDHHQLHQENSV